MISSMVLMPHYAGIEAGDSIISFDVDCVKDHLGAQDTTSDKVVGCEVTNQGHGFGGALAKLMARPMPRLLNRPLLPRAKPFNGPSLFGAPASRMPETRMDSDIEAMDSHGSVMTLSRYMIE